MGLPSDLGGLLVQPPHVRMVCACGGLIDALDRDDLRQHAVNVHRQTPEHQRWLATWGDEVPSFDVRVVERP